MPATELRQSLGRIAAVLRAMLGVPDYDRYVAHLRVRHPGARVPPREEFLDRCLADRHARPGSRCC